MTFVAEDVDYDHISNGDNCCKFDNDGNDHGYDNSDSNSNDLILKAVIGALE
ncbi:3485_t:CDS:2, partial [Entrophospora sp. SA101]